jgi:hypothetical protein
MRAVVYFYRKKIERVKIRKKERKTAKKKKKNTRLLPRERRCLTFPSFNLQVKWLLLHYSTTLNHHLLKPFLRYVLLVCMVLLFVPLTFVYLLLIKGRK